MADKPFVLLNRSAPGTWTKVSSHATAEGAAKAERKTIGAWKVVCSPEQAKRIMAGEDVDAVLEGG